jgi:oxidoreductase
MKVVVIGLGWVATEVWLPRLLGHKEFDVTGAVEPAAPVAASARRILGDIPVYRDHREVPNGDAECAFVLTPNHTHAELGEWFLRRGCCVMLEKPSCTRPQEIDRLERAARAGGGCLTMSAAARYRRDIEALRGIVRSGKLGTPRLADLSWVRARGIPRRPWFTSKSTSGGGVLIDLGWHVLDVAQQLWGEVDVRAAAAMASADFLRHEEWAASWHGEPSPDAMADLDVEDQLTALVTTDSYALRLRFAWASHEDIDRTSIVLHGSDAVAELQTTFGFSPRRVPSPSLRLKRFGQIEEVPVQLDQIGDEYTRQLDALAAIANDPRSTQHALACARNVLNVVSACYAAAA